MPMMPLSIATPIPSVLDQHVEEAAMLRHTRSVLVRAPHLRLHQLRRHDDRIAAHLDGIAVAGPHGLERCRAALERPGAGEVFAIAVRALEERDGASIERLGTLAAALPDALRGLLSALGWVSAPLLQGTVRKLLQSPDSLSRRFGLGACRVHRTDPGAALEPMLHDPDPLLRAEALRAAGELGRRDLLDLVRDGFADDEPRVVFWAGWSACLLGDRSRALELGYAASQDGEAAPRGLTLALLAGEFAAAHALVRSLTAQARERPTQQRRLISACGLLGDAQFVPWLVERMSDDRLARLVGEAFTLITGTDFLRLDLERRPPEGLESGPNDDPNDDNVAMDEDDGLPWPDQAKVQAWWQHESHRFQPGVRYLLGAPPSWEHCIEVLKTGYQRQRMVAAQTLCLVRPGTVLFNTAAPAWRQQRLLASMA